MRVAITCRMEYSVFSCGATNTAVALAELMKGIGHTATLLNFTKQTWWDDCVQVKKMFTTANIDEIPLNEEPPFDLILEVGNYVLSLEQRKALTKTSIWVLRKPVVIGEIEMSIYPTISTARILEGISETWLLNHVTSEDDVSLVEVLTRKPVRRLPFIWTPIFAEIHHRSLGGTPWTYDANTKFTVHIVDTNTSCTSNSTIPLVILRECAKNKLPIETWLLHNGEAISKSRFFRENVLKHCCDTDLSGECIGRQRVVEWTLQPNHIALAHLRFSELRPVLLDLAWVGIPAIHNSIALKGVAGFENFYYADNSIVEGYEVFKNAIGATLEGWAEGLKTRRESILRKWAPLSPPIRSEWEFHINRFKVVDKVVPVKPLSASSEFSILFTDMWDGFQPEYNFFTLLLNEAGKAMIPPRTVKGYSVENFSGVPNLIFFGPFSSRWTQYPGIPKVHFTGECTPRIEHPEVKLNLGFENYDMITLSYLRFPLWFLEINWFRADVERIGNPKPIPLELCTRTNETSFQDRSKFCSFIVSNPGNHIRNQAFHWINSYKDVDSAGALYNTVGSGLFAMQGGGGGELKKTKFMQDYKFAIAYENKSSDGYTTEKYLHAKAAGTVPIYWGDPAFQRDFNPAGCIDARDVKTPRELIELIKKCESEEEWTKRAKIPALDDYKVGMVRRTMAECAKRIYAIMGADISSVPDAIGCKAGSSEALMGMEYFKRVETIKAEVQVPLQVPLQIPILVTYVTFKFLGSLQHWLTGAKNQLRAFPDMKAIVFVGPDINSETIDALKEKYTYADFEQVPGDWHPPDFEDFWEPTHYAWKIWIYHTLVHREELKGKLILYMDAGAILVRYPKAWMETAQEAGIACLEDPREENDRWCGDAFCERLSVTDEERSDKQIVAGIMCFVAGHPVPTKFFDAAFEYAKERDTIVGPRLSGVAVDGKSYGHRQDQSILSILVRRQPIPLHPLDTVYCDHSMRRTFQTGRAIYVHRGNFQKSVPFIPGIEDAYVINLDRRADRLEKFWKTHPELEDRVHRQPAYDGMKLEMTPELETLFRPNDFFWKKAVTGCALSHLSLWWKLVNEHPDIHNYLIFEDDAQLHADWEDTLTASMAHVPEDYDVLYLGGILPPNRAAFETVLEPVTKYYSRIKPHQVFGQPTPTPYFHSCAYAYVISRNGALKVLNSIQAKQGYWTSADHMLCSPCDIMNLYFLTPIVAGCFQDSDPAYANSQFNNFSRVDKFDSDLWNNDERFPVPTSPVEEFDSVEILRHIFNGVPKKVPIVQAPIVQAPKYTGPTVVDENNQGLNVRFLHYSGKIDFSELYEGNWLLALFGNLKSVCVEAIDEEAPTDCPIVIVQRPHVKDIHTILKNWSDKGASFKVLHLSDEFSEGFVGDCLDIYELDGCKSVLRFYIRNDFPLGTESKVQIIPLGYHWSELNIQQSPLIRTPQLPFREFHWSFHGTNWMSRREDMAPLFESKLISSYKFYKVWNDPENLSSKEYTNHLLNSVFVPCPHGMNPETFRLYEALEAGCIPLVIHSELNDVWFRWITTYIPLLDISSWSDAVRTMYKLIAKPETLQIYRTQLLNAWVSWYSILRIQTTKWLTN